MHKVTLIKFGDVNEVKLPKELTLSEFLNWLNDKPNKPDIEVEVIDITDVTISNKTK